MKARGAVALAQNLFVSALEKTVGHFIPKKQGLHAVVWWRKTTCPTSQSFQPDLVLLDINLPDDTGLRLCEEMHQTNVMIVMLSSMTDDAYILEAFARGADDYITKPFDLQILKARFEAVFNKVCNFMFYIFKRCYIF